MASKWETPELVAEQEAACELITSNMAAIKAAKKTASGFMMDDINRAFRFAQNMHSTDMPLYLHPSMNADTLGSVARVVAWVQAGYPAGTDAPTARPYTAANLEILSR